MIQKKKILFLTRLYHPHIGGVEKHVEEISKILSARDFSITIVTEQFDKSIVPHEKKGTLEIIRIPVPQSPFLKKFYIWKWMFFNRNLFVKQDIIHIHDVFYWILPIKFLLPGITFFITYHGYEEYPIKKRWILLRKLGERLSNGTICVGDFMKKWYKASPTSVIYGGVRLRNQKIKETKMSALFFGRLDDQTGFKMYLQSYNKLKKMFPNFHLTVVGEGRLKGKIPNDVEYHLFTRDISPFILKNRFIFVSRYLSMLEALAAHKEVIAVYDNPIKKDYLQMSPFEKYVFIAKDPDSIAKHIQQRLYNGKKELKTEKGYAWASAQTWQQVVEEYMNLWNIKK